MVAKTRKAPETIEDIAAMLISDMHSIRGSLESVDAKFEQIGTEYKGIHQVLKALLKTLEKQERPRSPGGDG